jgi:hypothetical protein
MQTEEALEAVLAWLTSTVQRLTDDPLLQLAGSFASPVTDVSDQHDAYIGQSIQGKTYVDYYR